VTPQGTPTLCASHRASDVTVHPGTLHAEPAPGLVHTVLGSCVAVCLFDPVRRWGGMNHYVLPLWNGEGLPSPRYGNIAIAKLLEKMLWLGSRRQNLQAKVFGGGALLGVAAGLLNIGERNVILAADLLGEEAIPIVARDVGGEVSRKLIFNTGTGEVFVRRLGNARG